MSRQCSQIKNPNITVFFFFVCISVLIESGECRLHFQPARAGQLQRPHPGRDGDHHVPSDHLREPSDGPPGNGECAAVRGHVPQLAAECV